MRDTAALTSTLLLIAVALPLCGGADRGRSPSAAACGAQAPTSSTSDHPAEAHAATASCTIREMISRISRSPRAGAASGGEPAGFHAAGVRWESLRCGEMRGGSGEAFSQLDPAGNDPAGMIRVVDVWDAGELGQMEGGLESGMDARGV